MNSFVLSLCDASRQLRIAEVVSFVGADASGSFGIRAYHAPFMTALTFGLARFRTVDEGWNYLALPGGILYFNHNELTLSTRHFLLDTDFERVAGLLERQLAAEEENLQATRDSLRHLERAMFKRLLAQQRKRE
jgi:F-type H+-transporting ATPase subunit epsilon